MGNEIFILMQTMITITREMDSPFSHPLPALIPSETQWNRKISVFTDNMPNTMCLLYLKLMNAQNSTIKCWLLLHQRHSWALWRCWWNHQVLQNRQWRYWCRSLLASACGPTASWRGELWERREKEKSQRARCCLSSSQSPGFPLVFFLIKVNVPAIDGETGPSGQW